MKKEIKVKNTDPTADIHMAPLKSLVDFIKHDVAKHLVKVKVQVKGSSVGNSPRVFTLVITGPACGWGVLRSS